MIRFAAMILLAVALLLPSAPTRVLADSVPPVYLPIIFKSQPVNPNPVHAGIATYYYATGGGSCLFEPSPSDLMVAAMNDDEYGHAAYCGAYVSVTGRKGTVIVRIVDRCPGCAAGHLDLSEEAFAQIDNLSAGRVPITWQVVSPELNGPVAYHFNTSSSRWWTAVQIRNHRNPIASFEYRAAGSGAWVSVPRQDWNYFVASNGMGLGPYDFRVMDWYGNVLTDSGIPLEPGGTINGSQQFPGWP